MSADFLSGLLLVGVLLFGAAYLIKTFFWESITERMTTPRAAAAPPRQPNDHLVGALARVVDDGAASGTPRVRVGMETWRARVDSETPLTIGAEVEVKAIEGLVLRVAPKSAAAEHTA